MPADRNTSAASALTWATKTAPRASPSRVAPRVEAACGAQRDHEQPADDDAEQAQPDEPGLGPDLKVGVVHEHGLLDDDVHLAQRAGLADVVLRTRQEVVQADAVDRLRLADAPGDAPQIRAAAASAVEGGDAARRVRRAGEVQRADGGDEQQAERDAGALAKDDERRDRGDGGRDQAAARLGRGQPDGAQHDRDREHEPAGHAAHRPEQRRAEDDRRHEARGEVVRIGETARQAVADRRALDRVSRRLQTGQRQTDEHRHGRADDEARDDDAHVAHRAQRGRDDRSDDRRHPPCPDVRIDRVCVVGPQRRQREPDEQQQRRRDQPPVARGDGGSQAPALARGAQPCEQHDERSDVRPDPDDRQVAAE